jgi:hypothetical protein
LKVKKLLLLGAAVLVAVAVLAQLVYTFSGSGQWELMGSKNGVTVYSMKTPGSNIKKFKSVWKVHSTLSRFVMFAQDSNSDLQMGYWGVREVARTSQQEVWNTWKMKFPKPFSPRQFVIHNEFWQDAKTKDLYYRVTATPDKIPPDDCCVRVEKMSNLWRLQPLPNGDLNVEWEVYMDPGVPYFLVNSTQPRAMFRFPLKLQKWLDREQYKTARYDWVHEVQQ